MHGATAPDTAGLTRAVPPPPLRPQVFRAIPVCLRPTFYHLPAGYTNRALETMCSAARTRYYVSARSLRAGITWSDATAKTTIRSIYYFKSVRLQYLMHTPLARAPWLWPVLKQPAPLP